MFACALTDSHWGDWGQWAHCALGTADSGTVGQWDSVSAINTNYLRTLQSRRRFNEIKADTRQTSSLMQSYKFPRAPNPLPCPLPGTRKGTATHPPALPGYIFLLPATFRQMNELCACFCRVELTVSIKATLNPLAARARSQRELGSELSSPCWECSAPRGSQSADELPLLNGFNGMHLL